MCAGTCASVRHVTGTLPPVGGLGWCARAWWLIHVRASFCALVAGEPGIRGRSRQRETPQFLSLSLSLVLIYLLMIARALVN
jgi:hypothetical protein